MMYATLIMIVKIFVFWIPDPSTSNLLALAKLYEVSVEEILKKMK